MPANKYGPSNGGKEWKAATHKVKSLAGGGLPRAPRQTQWNTVLASGRELQFHEVFTPVEGMDISIAQAPKGGAVLQIL